MQLYTYFSQTHPSPPALFSGSGVHTQFQWDMQPPDSSVLFLVAQMLLGAAMERPLPDPAGGRRGRRSLLQPVVVAVFNVSAN